MLFYFITYDESKKPTKHVLHLGYVKITWDNFSFYGDRFLKKFSKFKVDLSHLTSNAQ